VASEKKKDSRQESAKMLLAGNAISVKGESHQCTIIKLAMTAVSSPCRWPLVRPEQRYLQFERYVGVVILFLTKSVCNIVCIRHDQLIPRRPSSIVSPSKQRMRVREIVFIRSLVRPESTTLPSVLSVYWVSFFDGNTYAAFPSQNNVLFLVHDIGKEKNMHHTYLL
jgi:hypothetical protein